MAEASGLQVPRDLSLVGIDNTPEGQLKQLTTIGFAYSDIGKFALESCMNLIAGGEARSNRRVVPVELIERTSVAPPRL
jgi:DNA-binding LacI/PurR family transcriptional regulator